MEPAQGVLVQKVRSDLLPHLRHLEHRIAGALFELELPDLKVCSLWPLAVMSSLILAFSAIESRGAKLITGNTGLGTCVGIASQASISSLEIRLAIASILLSHTRHRWA